MAVALRPSGKDPNLLDAETEDDSPSAFNQFGNADSGSAGVVSTTEAPRQAQQLEVLETAFWVGEGDRAKFSAVIRNPNTDFIGNAPQLSVTLRDAAGQVVGVSTHAHGGGVIPPGATRFTSRDIGKVTGKPATVEVTVARVDWQSTFRRPEEFPDFTVLSKSVARDPSGYPRFAVRGEVRSPYTSAVDEVTVVVILRNGGGRLVGGAMGDIHGVTPGGTATYEVTEQAVPSYNSVEVRAYPGGVASFSLPAS